MNTIDTHTEHNPKNPINEIEVDVEYVPSVSDNYENYTGEVPEAISQYIVYLERKNKQAVKGLEIVEESLNATGNGLKTMITNIIKDLKR
jgi:hypothetical protein